MNELNIFSWSFSRISIWLYSSSLEHSLHSFLTASIWISCGYVSIIWYFRHSSSFTKCLIIFYWLPEICYEKNCRRNLKHQVTLHPAERIYFCLWQAVRWEAGHFNSFGDWMDSKQRFSLYKSRSILIAITQRHSPSEVPTERPWHISHPSSLADP